MPRRQPRASILDLKGYSLPTYHDGQKKFIDFYYIDSCDNRKLRKKYHLDSIEDAKIRKRYAQQLIADLTFKLESGWRPYHETDTSDRSHTKISEVFAQYRKKIEKDSTYNTVRSYGSWLHNFSEWLQKLKKRPVYICDLKAEHIVGFLDHLLLERNISPRTHNNYRNFLIVLCRYLVRQKYIPVNIAEDTEKLKERKKIRRALTKEELQLVTSHLRRTDRYFLLAVMMEYYTMIRPGELIHVRIGDISVKEQSVFVSGEYSKNGRSEYVALNQQVIMLMVELKVLERPSSDYLFGRAMMPGRERQRGDIFNKRWAKMRKELGFGQELQFYSLKDSGIRDLANAEGIVIARDQARHTDIHTTNKYLGGRDRRAPEAAKSFRGELY
ncbi:MAG: tyrosine-type recombinase/integrase [Bacteroidales bacterium]|nr:tyrosine-type recombinase/integrase [Bacteroidales bacterium]